MFYILLGIFAGIGLFLAVWQELSVRRLLAQMAKEVRERGNE